MKKVVMLRNLRKFVALLLSLDLAFLPAFAAAQQAAPSIVIDNHTMPGAPAPDLDRTANGVQQLNIAHPNGAGLSHNMFTEYGVERKGLILNNATQATQTQLGGHTYGNANLNGTSARVILNEVTGPHASQMLGTTEVAGPNAHVVIANPNGITCNGCGFINTGRATLTTGRPEFDATGKLSSLRVEDGLVAFEGKGGDFSAVPVLDILSRRVKLDAQVNAQTARLVVGRNRVDYATGQVQPLGEDGSPASGFAIDSSALGGLYAGRISMLVNEAGAGVRVDGTMAANAGDMTLTTEGQLVLHGTMSASGRIGVTAGEIHQAGSIQSGASTQIVSRGIIDHSGEIQSRNGIALSGGSLRNTGAIKAAGNAGINIASQGETRNGGTIAAGDGGLSVSSRSIRNDADAVLIAQRQIDLQSVENFANSGQIASQEGAVALRSGGRISQSGGEIAAQGGALTISSDGIGNDRESRITARDSIRLAAPLLNNSGTIIAGREIDFVNHPSLINAGTIQASSLSASALQSLDNSGAIQTESGALYLAVENTLRNGGTLYGATSATIGAKGALDNGNGQIGAGSGAVTVTAGSVSNKGGRIVATSGALGLRASGDIDNGDGTLSARDGALSVSGKALANDGSGVIYASGKLTAELAQYRAGQDASLASDAGLALIVSGELRNDGRILSAQGMTLEAGSGLRNDAHGRIVATRGGLSVAAQGAGLANDGQLGTLEAGAVSLRGRSYAGSGLVQSVGSLALQMDKAVSISGSLLAGRGDLSLTAGSLSSTGQIGAQNGALTVSSGAALRNGGTLYGATSATIGAKGALDNGNGQIGAGSGAVTIISAALRNRQGRIISAKSGVSLISGEVDNRSGTIQGLGEVSAVIKSLDNRDGGAVLSLGSDLRLTDDARPLSVVQNQGGTIGATGLLALSTREYVSDARSFLLGNGGLVLALSGALDNRGVISSGQALFLTADRLNNAEGGLIAAKDGDLTLMTSAHAADVFSNSGIIQNSSSGRSLSIVTSGLLNAGSILGNGTVSVSADETVRNTGKLSALNGGLELHASSLQNTGTMAASDLLSLQLADTVGNEGTLYGARGVNMKAGKLDNSGQGQIGADAGTVSIATGHLSNVGGIILSTGRDLLISANELVNTGGILQGQTGQKIEIAALSNRSGGQILTRNGKLDIAGRGTTHDAAIINDEATIQASSSLTIEARSLTNRNGTLLTTAGGMSIALGDDGTLDNTGGIIQSAADLSLVARSYRSSTASILAAHGDMGLAFSGDAVNAGHMDAEGDLSLSAGAVINQAGESEDAPAVISGRGSMVALNARSIANDGAIQAAGVSGALRLGASRVENRGTIAARRDIDTTTTGDLVNTGTLISHSGKLAITTQSLSNAGFLGSGAATRLFVRDSATNSGTIFSGAGVIAHVAGQLDNHGGQIGTANGDIALDASRFANRSGRVVAQGGALTLAGMAIDNVSGVLQAEDALALNVSQFDNTRGLALSRSADVSVGNSEGPGRVINSKGIVQSNGSITIGFDDLANDDGQILAQSGDLSLRGTTGSNITNADGSLQATGALTIVSGSYTGSANSQVTSGRTMGLAFANGFHSAGKIASVGDLTLHAGSIANDPSGIIASTQGNLALESDTALTNRGVIQTSSSRALLSIQSGSMQNAAHAGIIGNGEAALLIQGGLENAGEITAHGQRLKLSASRLSNDNLMLSGGVLDLSLPGDLDNSGLIYALTDATLRAATIDNSGGQIGAGQGLLALSASILRNNQGGRIIGTDGSVRINAGAVANDNGLLQGGRDIAILTTRLSNEAGQILAVDGALSIMRNQAGHALDTLINGGGRLQAGSNLVAVTQQFESAKGTILTQGGDLSLTAGQGMRMGKLDLTGGTLQSGRDLTLHAGMIAGVSAVQAARNLDFSTAQDTGGFLFSAGNDMRLGLDAGWHIAAGAGAIAGNSLDITAPTIENNGALMAGGSLSLSSSGSLTNTGLISGTRGVSITLDGDLTNRQGAILSDAGDLTIGGRTGRFAGNVTNSSGQILTGSARGDVVISARSLSNDIIGGVSYLQGLTVYSQTYDQALANPPTPANLNGTDQYYWGQKVMAVQTPAGLLTADGKAGSGYVLVALYGGKETSKVVVTGVGSLATTENAPSIISAGHDLIVTTEGAITNDASHLAAGNDIVLKGGALNNVGYDTSVTYTLTCYNGNSCRWYMPPDEPADPWFPGGWQIGSGGGWPWPSQIWGSSRSTGLSGSIVAVNSLTGDFAGQINNTTIIEHATSEQLAAASQYQGGTPDGVQAPVMNGLALGGGALTMPETHRPAGNIDISMSGGTNAQEGVSGSGFGGGFLPGTGQHATVQSGHDGLGAFETGDFSDSGNPDLGHVHGAIDAPGAGGLESGNTATGGGSLHLPGQGNGLAGSRPDTGGPIDPGGLPSGESSGLAGGHHEAGSTVDPGDSWAEQGAGLAEPGPGNGGIIGSVDLEPGQGGSSLAGSGPSTGGSAPSLVGGGVLPQEGVQTAADAAQNLRLPGFLNSSDPSVMQVITSIPAGRALYVPNPSPQAHYLVETNPAYTSLTAFHGSQYLLDRLSRTPSDYTFLGDSYFDQHYVQQQIISATGQTFLGGTFVNASLQMQQLVTNGADEAQRLGLTFGRALSDEQKASLTQNIVWYVPVQVNGATVLAPKLYLAPGNAVLRGATIAAKDVSLAGSSVTNSGTISGSNSLSILARNGDITNTGTLAGGSVSLVAQNGSIINSATLNDYLVNGGNQGQLGSVGTITASGAASLSASNDITFNGGRLSSGGDLSILAGNSLTLGAATVRQATAVKGADVSSAFSQTQNYTSSITAGGNAVLAALGGDLKSAGATIDSTGNMVLSAAKSLDLGSVTDSSSHDISGSKSGFLTHSRFTDTGSLSVERGSNVTAGGTLTGLSGGDMSLKGLIGAQGDVTLSAGGTLTLEATKTQSEASASHHVAGISLSS